MLSKRERFFRAVERLGALRCPVCGGELKRRENDLACDMGHCLAVNRRGCVNMLQRQSDSCYDAALFEARGRVLSSGIYDPVVASLEALLPISARALLDAGCGEGWYLSRLLGNDATRTGAGVDISRDAVLRATDHPCEAVWVVGDLRRLPFADASFDAVLDVLTPAGYDSFRRVLRPAGRLLKVYPGREYLREIREARGLTLYDEGNVSAWLREHTTVTEERHIYVTKDISPELWRDFVRMTPLNQRLTAEEVAALSDRPADHITIDLKVAACAFTV